MSDDESAPISAFPPRAVDTVRVDSPAEELAYIAAWPHPDGVWTPASSAFVPGIPSMQKHVAIRAPDERLATIRFLVGTYHDARRPAQEMPSQRVEAAMRAAHELAKAEGPLHPGSMPQYPVPSPTHGGAVAVPLPILAIDARRRGLYAPPRFAVVTWPGADPVGVGDVPGFDPDNWPPPRLSDWPPETVQDWSPNRLAGAIERFTAIWGRLLNVWFGGDRYPQFDDERLEARMLLAFLLPGGMLEFYAEFSPEFWTWLSQ